MNMVEGQNPVKTLLDNRKNGEYGGIPSYCCANELVIEAILKKNLYTQAPVLIEATSNQVNQLGGYTGMRPADFRDMVYRIADAIGFDRDRIILGGDHLGPLPWQDLHADVAMSRAKEMVREYVLAGYKKIHLDTSMHLGSDKFENFGAHIVAERGVELYMTCEEAYQELKQKNPNEIHPVFVVGSEVPIPGGTGEEKVDELVVTTPEGFLETVNAYKDVLEKHGLSEAWEHICAIVVQPGVEFGNYGIHCYNREEAASLVKCVSGLGGLVMEGHSTDYQTPTHLREMVTDGIAIIKVGPALTYALREALFAMSYLEKEIIENECDRANFMETLEAAMLANPKNWEKFYKGSEWEKRFQRRFSISDRSRYYFAVPEVKNAMAKLFKNFNSTSIPMWVLHQYMPVQYERIGEGKLAVDAKEIVIDFIADVVDGYNYAVRK